jgi:hypothetical protein
MDTWAAFWRETNAAKVMKKVAKPNQKSDINVVVVAAVALATDTAAPRGEDLLPKELRAKYRAAKKRLRANPRGK